MGRKMIRRFCVSFCQLVLVALGWGGATYVAGTSIGACIGGALLGLWLIGWGGERKSAPYAPELNESQDELASDTSTSFTVGKSVLHLNEGTFGYVREGKYFGDQAALKVLYPAILRGTTLGQLFQEMKAVKNLEHKNVVKYFGVTYNGKGVTNLVMEYLPQGSLHEYLQYVGYNFTTEELMKIALDACYGMEFLETHRVIHGNLAARNVMMGEDMTPKISDYGFTVALDPLSSHRSDPNGVLPVLWMAPEVIEFKIFSIKCDVWSFGVLLFEIFSNAARPIPAALEGTPTWSSLFNWLKAGWRLDRPPSCPLDVYDIMMMCWSPEPQQRPAFCQIVEAVKRVGFKSK